jgi:hypothetical protein
VRAVSGLILASVVALLTAVDGFCVDDICGPYMVPEVADVDTMFCEDSIAFVAWLDDMCWARDMMVMGAHLGVLVSREGL